MPGRLPHVSARRRGHPPVAAHRAIRRVPPGVAHRRTFQVGTTVRRDRHGGLQAMTQSTASGRLAGKVCGITGATGIAEAAAQRFAAEGARLFVVALREEDCVALAERIGPGVDFTWVAADLTDEDRNRARIRQVRRDLRSARRPARLRGRQRPPVRRRTVALDLAASRGTRPSPSTSTPRSSVRAKP